MASSVIRRINLKTFQPVRSLLCNNIVLPNRISSVCSYSIQPKKREDSSKYKLVIVGGGSGGCAVAAKFKSLGKDVAVIEPSDMHYYQPIWTLVGGGLKTFKESGKPMSQVLPESCEWIKEKAVSFQPENNSLKLASGEEVHYDYLVLALGLQLDYNKVPGLEAALAEDPRVASNYHPKYVVKTNPALQQFKGGNALFTFPNSPIKCAGAPQKIMYLAEEIFRKNNVRDNTKVIYNTALPVIFGVKKYADALQKVVADRNIDVNYRHSLAEVDHKSQTAKFVHLDDDSKSQTFKYDFLHATPPMSAPDVLKKATSLVNEAGFVAVNKETLQHDVHKNVFGIGDCTSIPTAKTAAAVAAQCGILKHNLSQVMANKDCKPMYDGYTSCPLITSSKTCILAEFDFDLQPLETLPINQGIERNTSYFLKANIMPAIYWNGMTKGLWSGPKPFRKLLHLGMSK